jgi:type I restriction enzyme S subunit
MIGEDVKGMTVAEERSEAGRRELPEGWKWVKLEELIKEAQSGFASGIRDENGVVQLRMNNVTNRGTFDWSSFIRVPTENKELDFYRLNAGDVLFNNTNSTELVGKSALFDGFSEPVVFSNHFTRLRTKEKELAGEYLSYWLQSQWQAGVFADICNRWIGQSAVQKDKLLALEIPLPPTLEEQKRIAGVVAEQMGAVERARAAARERLAAAKELPGAYLREVFESEEAQGWERKRLGEVGEIGAGITLGRKLFDVSTQKRPYLRVANVKDGYLDLSDVYDIDATEADIKKCELKYGDLLLTEGGDPDKLGRGTFWEEQISGCLHQNHIYRVRFDLNRFSPQFLSAQIGSSYGKAYFLAHAKQTTGIATINQQVLGGFPLMVPPLKEQQRIAEELQEKKKGVEQLKAGLEEQLRVIEELPGAILGRAFRGEI